THFDAPGGTDPVVLNLGSMGKGQAWVNGHHIGRYWTLVSPKDGCQRTCDYRGAYNSAKCTTNCGEPTQICLGSHSVLFSLFYYEVSYTKVMVIYMKQFTRGNPFKISIKSLSTCAICAQVSETHYPPLRMWTHSDLINRRMVVNNMTPEMHLRCEDGHTISSIEFASYGTPQGSCQMFSRGNCHAPNSLSVVSQFCECGIIFSLEEGLDEEKEDEGENNLGVLGDIIPEELESIHGVKEDVQDLDVGGLVSGSQPKKAKVEDFVLGLGSKVKAKEGAD
ncbi:hypothetical protein RJ639_016353, partial [Escallonia herrerae]